MTLITFPSDTVDIIDAIRHAIGRNVTFIIVASSNACTVSGCNLDPATDKSTNSWCPTCSGEYWIPVYSGYTVSGHITWAPSDYTRWYETGQQVEGDVRVQIKYTDEAIYVIENTVWAIVDDKIMEIKKKMLRGVQPLNRILIDMIEKEE